jgi:hypothetical protein
LTAVASVPLILLLAGTTAFGEDDLAAAQAIDQALASPEGMFWGAIVGFGATFIGALYGARRAQGEYVRHGGWVAVLSLVLALPFYFVPGAQSTIPSPLWYELFTMAGMVPVGILGGFVARQLAEAAA